jgi:kanamycin kinase
MPDEIRRFIGGARVFDSSCSPEARVYYIEKDEGFYLKRGAAGTLEREALLTRYFHSLGLGTEVLEYTRDAYDWMLSAKMRGEDCTHAEYTSNPKRLCDTIAYELRALHEIDFKHCPVQNKTAEYLALAEKNYVTGNYDRSYFPDSFGYASAEEAYAVLSEGGHLLKRDTLLHGDYCLPNIMLDGWKLSGFIDLGGAGVSDRHIDLFWGAWTLSFNLGTDEYRGRFFDAYGRDRVDEDMLKIVAAAEVFG